MGPCGAEERQFLSQSGQITLQTKEGRGGRSLCCSSRGSSHPILIFISCRSGERPTSLQAIKQEPGSSYFFAFAIAQLCGSTKGFLKEDCVITSPCCLTMVLVLIFLPRSAVASKILAATTFQRQKTFAVARPAFHGPDPCHQMCGGVA